MNREQEHSAIRQEFCSYPPELNEVYAKAKARARKRTIRNSVIRPMYSIVALFVLCVSMVNLSPTVAAAMERIPGLQQLAEFVSFSPSLTEVVEHEFVQAVGMEQAVGDDVTMRIEHVVIDGLQLHIFYMLESPVYTNMAISLGAFGTDAIERVDCIQSTCFCSACEAYNGLVSASLLLFMNSHDTEENGALRHVVVGFDDLLPSVVFFKGDVLYLEPDRSDLWNATTIGQYSFAIVVDEVLAVQKIFEVNYEFVLEDQRFAVATVELNSAHTRVNLETDWRNNTEHLHRLTFYMINERGERFYPPSLESGGLINLPTGGTGDDDDGPWRMEDHFLETAFFSESESLTLVITAVEWKDKLWIGEGVGAGIIHLDEPIEIPVK